MTRTDDCVTSNKRGEMTTGNTRHDGTDRPFWATPLRLMTPVVCGAAAVFAPVAAQACPVCWGDSGDPLVKGAASGVIALGAIVYALLMGFVGFGVMFWVRARRLAAAQRDS